MIILGIDPGTAITGYGIIEYNPKSGSRDRVKYIGCGCILTSKEETEAQRLEQTYQGMVKIIQKCRPDVISVEKLFFFKNAKTAISVSQARGVVILAAQQKKIPLAEFTPLQIKMAVTGYGKADKKQIQKMIKTIFGLKEIPKPDDAADALAAAFCFANSYRFKKLVFHS